MMLNASRQMLNRKHLSQVTFDHAHIPEPFLKYIHINITYSRPLFGSIGDWKGLEYNMTLLKKKVVNIMFAHICKTMFFIINSWCFWVSIILPFSFNKLSNQILPQSQAKLYYFNVDDIKTFCLTFGTIRLRRWTLSKHQLSMS